MGLLSQISLPVGPVPLTLQTFGIYLIGVFLGEKRGLAAVAAYLIEGSLGLPVFAGGSFGLVHLFGLTGGYLPTFLPELFLLLSPKSSRLQ
ncbi:MAG: biotin transporter BioY [Victivallaceae bacterium]